MGLSLPIYGHCEETASRWLPAAPRIEPAERLIEAITSQTGVLVLRTADARAAAWLTEGRIEEAIGPALMGPTDVEIWSPTEFSRIVGLRFPSDSASPMRCLEIHALCRGFTERLVQAWKADDGPEGAFSITPITPLSHLDNLTDNIAELNALLEILVNRQLTPQFQPIVSLRDGRVFGYETLIRGPKGALIRRPGQMFRVADKARVVAWFDLACLEECLNRAAEQRIRHLLFVNMDAEGLAAMAMQERPIALRVRELCLSPTEIVIEITERQMVGDFPRLLEDIGKLREQGFRIAIDDAGAGYSSLRAVSELRPDFLKIDRDLVKNLDVAGERSALLKAIADYAQNTGAAVVAEGAETLEEVAALIELGIPFCQGFVLGKPSDTLRGTPRPLREYIQERVTVRERRRAGADLAVRDIARAGHTVDESSPLSEAARRFAKDSSLTSIVVLQEQRVVGLLDRRQFDHALQLVKAALAAEVMPDEEVRRWMRTDALRVQGGALVREVVQQVVSTQDLTLDTDVVVLGPSEAYEGVVSVRSLMDASATLPARRAQYADPLTGLPSRVPLEQDLRARLESNRSLAVIRVDLTHLAQVNDRSGLRRGDELIQAVASLITAASVRFGQPTDLVAHLGGDNFVVLTSADCAHPVCREIVETYQRTQHPRGEQTAVGRAPSSCALAVGAVTNRARRFQNADQVMAALHEVMHGVRLQPGSRFAIDYVR
ncbi:MAG TPA: bifunctional diguanylate cyclase/phosphodiesterase [Chthonomonadaceae bacterium]|nr:bifunctional diguanylate cyclase/phosphodiesterase [Chthonomonadaceae bacterium]